MVDGIGKRKGSGKGRMGSRGITQIKQNTKGRMSAVMIVDGIGQRKESDKGRMGI